MQVLSFVWGVLALLATFAFLLPCLGALNWLNIPFAAAGLIVGVIALTTARDGSRNLSIAGIVCCVAAILIGLVRLAIGGGVL